MTTHTSKTDAERNLLEFLDKYGREGFLKLFFANYLFELAMYYLHSGKNPSAQVREDTGYRFYVDGRDQVYEPEQIEQFKQDLLAECEKKAILIVEKLKQKLPIERLGENFMEDPEVAQIVHEVFKTIIQRG